MVLRLARAALLVACLVPSRAPGEEPVRGVVAAEHELAARAGAEVLDKGGNALDAAVAAGFAVGVLNPSSCGIGGGGFLLYYDADERRLHALDFRERAPGAASRDMFVRDGRVDPAASLRGGLAVAVPGEVKGLTEALERFGRLGLVEVMAPAIRHAMEGFPVGAHLASEIAANSEQIRSRPALAAVYLRATGAPYRAGEKLVQRDLGATLRAIASRGADAFYRGAIAEKIAETVAREGGILTEADLADYRVRWREPLTTTYRGLTVAGFPPPSSGGVLLEALNVLAGFDLRAAGARSPAALHLLAETEKRVFADRARDYGDPDFTAVPLALLLSPTHARRIRERIVGARSVEGGGPRAAERGGTSHLSVIDREGNAAALTSTINTAFGSLLIVPGTGIVLNNEMDDFSAAPGVPNVYGLTGAEANSIRPGKRPLSSMSPTLVLRGSTPMLAIGASGGPRIITATLATIVHLVDFGLPLDEAVRAPRIHHQWRPDLLFHEPGFDREIVSALGRVGHRTAEAPELGAVQAVFRGADGLVGVADPRKGGGVASR